jgi:hypothetical protein
MSEYVAAEGRRSVTLRALQIPCELPRKRTQDPASGKATNCLTYDMALFPYAHARCLHLLLETVKQNCTFSLRVAVP